MMKLSLEWKIIDKQHVALIFDKPTFAVFQQTADTRGVETTDMIVEALVKLLGPIAASPIKD